MNKAILFNIISIRIWHVYHKNGIEIWLEQQTIYFAKHKLNTHLFSVWICP